MSKAELDDLVRIGKLKLEPASRVEFDGMVSSARTRLVDAQNEGLDPDSQFDLAYGVAHRLALMTLRQLGYRRPNFSFPNARSHRRNGQGRHSDLPSGSQRAKPGRIRRPYRC